MDEVKNEFRCQHCNKVQHLQNTSKEYYEYYGYYLCKECVDQGFTICEDCYSFFVPKNMAPEELALGCYKARLKFNSAKSLLSRAFDFKSNTKNMKIFAMSNYVTKKEILKKQGIRLG